MSNVVDINSREKEEPHIVVNHPPKVSVIRLSDIESIALGTVSVLDFDDPDSMGSALAAMAMDSLNNGDE